MERLRLFSDRTRDGLELLERSTGISPVASLGLFGENLCVVVVFVVGTVAHCLPYTGWRGGTLKVNYLAQEHYKRPTKASIVSYRDLTIWSPLNAPTIRPSGLSMTSLLRVRRTS